MAADKRRVLGVLIELITLFIIVIIIDHNCTYKEMAYYSIVQLIVNCIIVIVLGRVKLVSVPIFFISLTWMFHCGQILLKGYDIDGTITLDFTKYAAYSSQLLAFKFYMISQVAIAIGTLAYRKNRYSQSEEEADSLNYKDVSKWLIIIGIVPRIYIDVKKLIGGIAHGYKGVYSLYIPQFINTLGFFCDIGVSIVLFKETNIRKRRVLFLIVLIYKSIAMMTGSRQEKVAFLIIWLFIYFSRMKTVKISNVIGFILIILAGSTLIDSIGNTRSMGNFSMANLFESIKFNNSNNIFNDSLGEFGSAFSSLEIPFDQISNSNQYAYGKSYFAGLLSTIPLLVSNIPSLASETTYITKFSNTTFFGGSFLGEAYYNFSWLGMIIGFLSGYLSAFCDKYIRINNDNEMISIRSIMAMTFSISLLLFVRGYFTDMVQKTVWVLLAFYFIQKLGRGRNYDSRNKKYAIDQHNHPSL